jgi:hypothetical protein
MQRSLKRAQYEKENTMATLATLVLIGVTATLGLTAFALSLFIPAAAQRRPGGR